MSFPVLTRVRSKFNSGGIQRNFSKSSVAVPNITDTDKGIVRAVDKFGMNEVELDRFPGSIVTFSDAWLEEIAEATLSSYEKAPVVSTKSDKLCDCSINQLVYGGCKCGGR